MEGWRGAPDMDTVSSSSGDSLVHDAVGAAVAAVVAAVVGTLAQMAVRAVVQALRRRRNRPAPARPR
jgi:phage-related minor tail protein